MRTTRAAYVDFAPQLISNTQLLCCLMNIVVNVIAGCIYIILLLGPCIFRDQLGASIFTLQGMLTFYK